MEGRSPGGEHPRRAIFCCFIGKRGEVSAHGRTFDAGVRRDAPLGFPWGKLAAERQRSRLMRVEEQSRFDVHAKLCVSAPRPSSVACGDSFPEGKPRGPQQIGTAAKERCRVPAGGAEPLPYVRIRGAVYGPMWSSAPTGCVRVRMGAHKSAMLYRREGQSPSPTLRRNI